MPGSANMRIGIGGGSAAGRRAVKTSATPGSRERGRGVDRDDPGVGVRAAQDGRVQRAGALEVVDEAAAAREQRHVLLPGQRAADHRLGARRSVARLRAWTASYHRYLISNHALRRRPRLPSAAASASARTPAAPAPAAAGTGSRAVAGGVSGSAPAARGAGRSAEGAAGAGCRRGAGRAARSAMLFSRLAASSPSRRSASPRALSSETLERRHAAVEREGDAGGAARLVHAGPQRGGGERRAGGLVDAKKAAGAARVLVDIDGTQGAGAVDGPIGDARPEHALEQVVAVDLAHG